MKEHAEKLETMMEPIKKVLPTDETTFACSGNMILDEPVGIYYKTKDGLVAYTEMPTINDDLRALHDACATATFGIGNKEVTDETYRKALKLDTSAFATSFQISGTNILNMVHKLLVPNAGSVRAELYKLNMYEEGSFFKPHKDTPRGSDMFGSLVICLDQPFTGGSFVVEHNGKVQEYDESTRVAGSIQWIAFFSDCLHEVKTVTSGSRVTLTYNLYRESKESSMTPSISIGLLKAVTELFDKDVLKGCIIGFPLEHKYVLPSTDFKGNDLILWNTLKKAAEKGQAVAVPYLHASEVEEIDLFDDEEGDGSKDKDLFIKWGSFSACEDLYERRADTEWYKEAYKANPYDVVWVKKPIARQYVDTVAAYGNEPSTSDIYYGGCILMKIL